MNGASALWVRRIMVVVLAGSLAAVFLPAIPPVQAQSFVATIAVGDFPNSMAVNPNTNRVYVVNDYSHTISVINGATHSVIATWTFGILEVGAVAINTQTNRLYIANGRPITILDATSGARLGTINDFLQQSNHIAINSQTNRIYICDIAGLVGSPDRLLVYDGNTNAEITTIDLGVDPAWQSLAVAVNEVTNMVYVAYSLGSRVFFINGATNAVERTISLTDLRFYNPDIAVNTTTNQVYVKEADRVTILDGATGAEIGRIPGFWNIEVNSAANRVYLYNDHSFQILDGSTRGLLYNINMPYPDFINWVGVNPATNLVYLANSYGDKVKVLHDDLLVPATATFTATRPPTRTRTATASPTPTRTRTPTMTPLPTSTPTPTCTPSATPTRFPTPIGGWPSNVFLPLILKE